MIENLLNICPNISFTCQCEFPVAKNISHECKNFNLYTFHKVSKLNPHFWWPKNCVNILENYKPNAPNRCINQFSTFAQFASLMKYLYFLSKFTFSEMEPMKTIWSKLTFLYLKTGHAWFGSFIFCASSSTQNRPNGTKMPNVVLDFHF